MITRYAGVAVVGLVLLFLDATESTAQFTRQSNSSPVEVLSANFEIPYSGRTRRIYIYLPPDYNSTSKSYPVIYALDGQLLFD